MRTIDLNLDFNTPALQRTNIILNQANKDSISFNIRAYIDAAEINYLDYDRAEMVFQKPDHSNVTGDADISTEGVAYSLGAELFAVAGLVKGYINFYVEDTITATLYYTFMVVPDLLNPEKISGTYVSVIENLRGEAAAIREEMDDILQQANDVILWLQQGNVRFNTGPVSGMPYLLEKGEPYMIEGENLLYVGNGTENAQIGDRVQSENWTAPCAMSTIQYVINALPKTINATVILRVYSGTNLGALTITGFKGTGALIIVPYDHLVTNQYNFGALNIYDNTLKTIYVEGFALNLYADEIITNIPGSILLPIQTRAAVICADNTGSVSLSKLYSGVSQIDGLYCKNSNVTAYSCAMLNKGTAFKVVSGQVSLGSCTYTDYVNFALDASGLVSMSPAFAAGVAIRELNGGKIFQQGVGGGVSSFNQLTDIPTDLAGYGITDAVKSVEGELPDGNGNVDLDLETKITSLIPSLPSNEILELPDNTVNNLGLLHNRIYTTNGQTTGLNNINSSDKNAFLWILKNADGDMTQILFPFRYAELYKRSIPYYIANPDTIGWQSLYYTSTNINNTSLNIPSVIVWTPTIYSGMGSTTDFTISSTWAGGYSVGVFAYIL